jgi:hypothetical protein
MTDEPFFNESLGLPIFTTSDEDLAQALDVIAKAGWITGYRIFPDYNEVSFTPKGEERMAIVSEILKELGLESVSPKTWWALRDLALK